MRWWLWARNSYTCLSSAPLRYWVIAAGAEGSDGWVAIEEIWERERARGVTAGWQLAIWKKKNNKKSKEKNPSIFISVIPIHKRTVTQHRSQLHRFLCARGVFCFASVAFGGGADKDSLQGVMKIKDLGEPWVGGVVCTDAENRGLINTSTPRLLFFGMTK